MDLKEMLGDAYKENMTFEEISTALSTKRLADLSTGKYVNKEAAEAEKRTLENAKKELEAQLNSKLTEDELKVKENQAKDTKIKELEEQIKNIRVSSNKNLIESNLAEMKVTLGIKEDDKEYNSFVDVITSDDDNNSRMVGTYLSKILKNAYEKGKNDAVKSEISKNGNLKQNSTDSNNNIKEDMGTRIAKQNKANGKTYNYFE